MSAIALLFFFFLFRILLRSERVAGVGCGLLLGLLYLLQSGGSWAGVPIQLLGGILTVYVLMRFGLLSSVVAWSVFVCFFIFPNDVARVRLVLDHRLRHALRRAGPLLVRILDRPW